MEADPAIEQKLEQLEAEARNYRFEQEATLCGEEAHFTEGLEHWARKWRKEFELHALPCELQKAVAAQERPAEKTPLPA